MPEQFMNPYTLTYLVNDGSEAISNGKVSPRRGRNFEGAGGV